MIGNFPKCVTFTLAQEGGYVDNPDDPGGATNMGITLATLSEWRNSDCTAADVQALTAEEAQAIYFARYWTPINGNNLPPGVDLMVFDFAVTSGPQTSAVRLQGLLGVAQDGAIGPRTIAATAGRNSTALIAEMAYSHEAYYRAMAGFAEFGAGWLARNARARQEALAMVPGAGVYQDDPGAV